LDDTIEYLVWTCWSNAVALQNNVSVVIIHALFSMQLLHVRGSANAPSVAPLSWEELAVFASWDSNADGGGTGIPCRCSFENTNSHHNVVQ